MTPEELDMMERIHFYGRFYQLNDVSLKMIKELLAEQEEVGNRENQA